jgi:hypothetical protein
MRNPYVGSAPDLLLQHCDVHQLDVNCRLRQMAAVIVTRTWSAGGGGGDLVPPDQESRSPSAHAVPGMTLFAAGT